MRTSPISTEAHILDSDVPLPEIYPSYCLKQHTVNKK